MITWNMLLNHDQYELGRNNHMTKLYENYKKGINLNDKIRNQVLKNKLFLLNKNLFPYDVEPGIEHFVLWYQPYLQLDNRTVHKILNFYKQKYGFQDYIFFENEPDKKSVTQIPHIQVFFKL